MAYTHDVVITLSINGRERVTDIIGGYSGLGAADRAASEENHAYETSGEAYFAFPASRGAYCIGQFIAYGD